MSDHPVVKAAMYWWRGKKPCEWSRRAHIQNPTINTTTKREYRLAKVCGEYAAGLEILARDRRRERKAAKRP